MPGRSRPPGLVTVGLPGPTARDARSASNSRTDRGRLEHSRGVRPSSASFQFLVIVDGNPTTEDSRPLWFRAIGKRKAPGTSMRWLNRIGGGSRLETLSVDSRRSVTTKTKPITAFMARIVRDGVLKWVLVQCHALWPRSGEPAGACRQPLLVVEDDLVVREDLRDGCGGDQGILGRHCGRMSRDGLRKFRRQARPS